MRMAMVGIRKMRMAVRDGVVQVRVGMARSGRKHFVMTVIVMLVTGAVLMLVAERKRLMGMRMLVAFGQVQPDAPRHQRARNEQRRRDRLPQDDDGQRGAHKWRDGKIRTRARSPQVTQAKDKQRQAGPITCKPQHGGRQHNGNIRPGRTQHQRKHQVGRAGSQAFDHGDERRIRQRDLARQVVVHAPGQARAGHNSPKRASPGQDNTTPPATMASMPSAMRLSKFSRNTNHAIKAVSTPSALSKSEAPEAGMPDRPGDATGQPLPFARGQLNRWRPAQQTQNKQAHT